MPTRLFCDQFDDIVVVIIVVIVAANAWCGDILLLFVLVAIVRDVVIYLLKLFQFESQQKTTQNNLGSQNPKPNPKHIVLGELKRRRKKRTINETHTQHVGL